MNAAKVLSFVSEIAAEKPTYRIGGTGADGTCDCIGLVMGAMWRAGAVTYPLHSTNYFSRWEMATLESIDDAKLQPMMLVFKARADAGELHERYQNGGRYYNGDLRDYYHVGVVTGVNPLEITHCTSGGGVDGITVDSSTKGWTHAGQMIGVDYDGLDVVPMPDTRKAVVQTGDGNPLKMRKDPSTENPYIAKIPNGDEVAVHADAQGWAKITWRGLTGYCMSQFLRYEGGEPQQPGDMPDWARQIMDKLDIVISLLGGDPVG